MKINDGSDAETNEGFMSAPVGLKYNLIRDTDRQFLLSIGTTYFIPGSPRVFGIGDGDFHFFVTGGKEIFDAGHWLSATGFRIPVDSRFGTQLWYWSNQWDYELPGNVYQLLGINWFHWMRGGTGEVDGNVTGLDLVNVPAFGVAGTNVVSCILGAKWKPSGHLEIGGGWEFPMSDRHDILGNRVYADIIFRY